MTKARYIPKTSFKQVEKTGAVIYCSHIHISLCQYGLFYNVLVEETL
jgi:hypothetical protein